MDRHAGKTTLARKIARDLGMQYISLDELTAFSSAQNDPQGFVDSLANLASRFNLIDFLLAGGIIYEHLMRSHK